MLEIEMKFPVADFAAVAQKLLSWRAQAGAAHAQADHYFNAPHRDFAQTDEALRIRRIGAGNRVTYKGPRREGPAKTRLEIEVGLADGEEPAADFARLLTALGFRPVAVVSKQRVGYHLRRGGFDLEVCLDEVAEVGRFVEVEILAPEGSLDRARHVLQDVSAELGLQNSERRSYLEMLLATKTKG